jgi:hypothetical protein
MTNKGVFMHVTVTMLTDLYDLKGGESYEAVRENEGYYKVIAKDGTVFSVHESNLVEE